MTHYVDHFTTELVRHAREAWHYALLVDEDPHTLFPFQS